MNNDESHSEGAAGMSEQTEARIVAWLLGEADAGEAAALQAIVAADPKLADLKARLERLLGLVERAEAVDPRAPRLPEGRRAALLKIISCAPQTPESAYDPYAFPVREAARRRRLAVTLGVLAAACATLGVLLSIDRHSRGGYLGSRMVLTYDASSPGNPAAAEMPAAEQIGDQEPREPTSDEGRGASALAPALLPDGVSGDSGSRATVVSVDAPRADAPAVYDTGRIGVPPLLVRGSASPAPESIASAQPLSAFSLQVGDASFRRASEALEAGRMPEPADVRPEEFYNAFDYGDPVPTLAEKVSCRVEQAVDPCDPQRNLVRVAMRVAAAEKGLKAPLSLVLLLDTSGSMARADRAASVRRAIQGLVTLLGRQDRVTLVGFSRHPRILADAVPGDETSKLLDVVSHTPPEGGTNLEEAVRLAGQLASRERRSFAQNRIILLTDGAANLGETQPPRLAALVNPLREKGIAFDACAVNGGGVGDANLGALARAGAGWFFALGPSEDDAVKFVRQVAGTRRSAAEAVRVQVRFNPERVGRYLLIGFEPKPSTAPFQADAGTGSSGLTQGDAAVAVYEVEPLVQGKGDLGEVTVRFRDASSGQTVNRSWTLSYERAAPTLETAEVSMQLAGTAALIAEKLQGGTGADRIKLARLAPEVAALRRHYAGSDRVQLLASMYDQMRRLHVE